MVDEALRGAESEDCDGGFVGLQCQTVYLRYNTRKVFYKPCTQFLKHKVRDSNPVQNGKRGSWFDPFRGVKFPAKNRPLSPGLLRAPASLPSGRRLMPSWPRAVCVT